MSQALQRTTLIVPAKTRTTVSGALLLAALLLSNVALSQETRASQAEVVAAQYLTAFFQGDLPTAASLTHPDTLNLVKSSFLEELRTAKSAGGKPVTPADYGLSLSTHELSELNAEALYVAVLEADRRRDPAFSKAMRRARIEVSDSREAPDSAMIVTLQVMSPTADGGASTQETSLLLRQSNSTWKVVGNAP